MLNLRNAIDAQVAALTAGGVRATADPRNVNPPCLLILPPAVTWRMRCYDATWTAYALATDAGAPSGLAQLGELIGAAQDALTGAITSATPLDVTLPDGAGTVPGYQLTWTTKHPT